MMEDVKMNVALYQTSDFYLAAWLLSKGFMLENLDHTDPKRFEFIFQDRPDRPELVKEFISGRAVGNVADFVYQLRRAKNLLYAESKGNR